MQTIVTFDYEDLDPARREDILRAPGIGLKAYGRLQEAALNAGGLQPSMNRRGGAGRGQGRKPIKQGEETVTVSLRMTVSQRAKLRRLGGGGWTREKIELETE